MANIVINAKIAHINMSPVGFVVYAEGFLGAYKSFEPDIPFSPPKYYLVCHSLELALKSYLSMKGEPIKNLKSNFGHNLRTILRKSKELGLDSVVALSEFELLEIEKANEWYNRKGFEYFAIQNIVEKRSSLPDLEVMSAVTERIIGILKPLCLATAQTS
jgi:hypothetical protein